MQKQILQKALQVVLLIFLVFAGLYYARPFLVPVCFAGLFAMLFLPVSRRFEKAGINRIVSVILCIFLLLLIITSIIMLITWQVTDLTNDLGNIGQKINQVIREFENFISKTFGITRQQQEQVIVQQSKSANGFVANLGSIAMRVFIDFILMLVYIFLFMYLRSHIKKFILKIVPKTEGANTEDAIHNIEKVTQQYLTGIGMMIVSLWIMYGIGFSLVGLKNSFFFAILCGLFEIVPFLGNLTGNTLAVLMAITQGGGFSMVVGIIITYGLVQFFQTYVLEPLVVGSRVNINPLFTIIGLVLGDLIWGIAGVVLAIPLLGIVKIICDHIEPMKPYGFLIGSSRTGKKRAVSRIFKKRTS